MITWLLGGLVVGLVALYLVSPPIRNLEISAARFFLELKDPERQAPLRFSLRRLATTPLFWLQLLALLLLLATVLAWRSALAADLGPQSIGLLLVVDASASMSTTQTGLARFDIARLRAAEALEKSQAATRGGSWCVHLASFDLETRDLGISKTPTNAAEALNGLAPRALGTDLELVRRLIAADPNQDPQCPITHAVVVTDRPEPSWRAGIDVPLTWVDIAQVVSNVGFTRIAPVRNELTGAVEVVQVQVEAFGPAPAASTLTIKAPDGNVIERNYTWGETVVWQDSFVPTIPGDYTLSLTPDGSYVYDDSATIKISSVEQIRVDWRLPDRTLLGRLGWEQTDKAPQVRILSFDDPLALASDSTTPPLLIVGPGYDPSSGPSFVGDFQEESSLLADLNLDVAEEAGMRGIDQQLPGFKTILMGQNGAVWIAARSKPSAVIIPGPPLLSDDNLGLFSQTVFFNGMRYLLSGRDFPALYTLTSLDAPEPGGNRLPLHEDEGDTGGEPKSAGSLDHWQSGAGTTDPDHLWPILLTGALAVLALERAVALLGGSRWS